LVPEISPLTWAVGIAALVLGILAGHFGWGRRWPARFSKLHPDYLAGLHYLVTEQPDRALDVFLKLMEANTDTLETHFALGALYRRRGEVERAIRIHQSLLAREALAPEYREQALLALAQDYLRAGLLDRAERLFQEVSEVPRLRATALDSLRGVYERQHEWRLALDTHRKLARSKAAPPRLVAAHYLCELAALSIERGDTGDARRLLREARRETAPFPRAAVLRAQIAAGEGHDLLAVRLLRAALRDAPQLIQEHLPELLRLAGPRAQDALLAELIEHAESRGVAELKRLVFAALSAGLTDAPPLRKAIETVFAKDAMLHEVWRATAERQNAFVGDALRVALEIRALLVHAERFRCSECGFAGRSFYWHCPACHAWDSFEAHAIVNLS
jgi:lipopolysaccharide biosynthesis regulator YciM